MYKEITGSRQYRPWKKWNPGDEFVGVYKEQKEDNYGNPSYIFEVISTAFSKKEDNLNPGMVAGLNSSGGFNVKMDQVNVGDTVRVLYNGVIILTKGKYKGARSHSINVGVGAKDITTEDAGADL
jgi:hypothetical protein